MSTLQQDRDVFIKALGYADYISFEEKTGLSVTITTGYGSSPTGFRRVNVSFKHPFYASYTNPGISSVDDFNKPTAEEITMFNKRLSYKKRQISKIEGIRYKAVEGIKLFIHEHFFIGKDKIKEADIEFVEYSRFKIAGGAHMFNYTGVLSYDSFTINSYCYHNSFKDTTAIVANMMKYYYNIDILKLKDNEDN